jgi:hypothetical protein
MTFSCMITCADHSRIKNGPIKTKVTLSKPPNKALSDDISHMLVFLVLRKWCWKCCIFQTNGTVFPLTVADTQSFNIKFSLLALYFTLEFVFFIFCNLSELLSYFLIVDPCYNVSCLSYIVSEYV